MKLLTNTSAEKLRGSFYTPEPIAEFILRWGINGHDNSEILEPSCGDGIFFKMLKKHEFPYQSITGIELDSGEAQKADAVPLTNKTVIVEDFHSYCNSTHQKFDLAIGNPPYIRYQYFDPVQQVQAEDIFIKAGLHYSRLTNAWVSFVVGASLLLKEKGKLGFVIPAEFLQVSYARQLRQFIAHHFNKINIISFKTLVFPEIQQEVILLLCEKNGSGETLIEHLELTDASELEKLDVAKLKSPKKKLDTRANKWTFYFLEQDEIDFLENIKQNKKIPELGKYAKVEVGITTGSNSFFTVPASTVDEYGLHDFVRPMVGRSVQVSSLVFSEKDWEKNIESGARANLVVFPENGIINNYPGALKYIAEGEKENIHKGYKCSVRSPWYVVPSLKTSKALFIRRNNLFPKMVLNEANAYTTDTMHRVYLKPTTNPMAFVSSFYNSLSLAFSEICGRSYGGGVLELMPNEVEKILLPYKIENTCLLKTIDKMLRANTPIEEILSTTNKAILVDGFGFSEIETSLATSIWKKLSSRRMNRAKSK